MCPPKPSDMFAELFSDAKCNGYLVCLHLLHQRTLRSWNVGKLEDRKFKVHAPRQLSNLTAKIWHEIIAIASKKSQP